MALQTVRDWTNWLSSIIPDEEVSEVYANYLVDSEITEEDLSELSHELLIEMGIVKPDHRTKILENAKTTNALLPSTSIKMIESNVKLLEPKFENYEGDGIEYKIVFLENAGNVQIDEMETDVAADSNSTGNEDLEGNAEKLYQCGACEATFAEYSELKEHVKKVRKNQNSTTHPLPLTPFHCMKCGKSYPTIGKLYEHVKTHIGVRSHVCPDCSKPFLRKRDMERHRKIHLDIPVPHEDSKLTSNEDLEEGKKEEENAEKFYQCGACEETFANYSGLKAHVKKVRQYKKTTAHPPKWTSFKCMKCGMKFSTMSVLNAHVKIHTGEKKHQCSQCPKRFLRKGELDKHMQTHLAVRPIKCEVCLKRFTRKENFELHMRTHTGEKPLECPVCQMCFSRPEVLSDHILTHSNEMNFKCKVCPGERLFKTRRYLARHMLTHTGVKRYNCFEDGCEMTFLTPSARERHERKHLNIKPFECEYCHKRFAHSGSLTLHTRIHTGEKPYNCELCGRAFREQGGAKKHMINERSKPIEERCDYKHVDESAQVVVSMENFMT